MASWMPPSGRLATPMERTAATPRRTKRCPSCASPTTNTMAAMLTANSPRIGTMHLILSWLLPEGLHATAQPLTATSAVSKTAGRGFESCHSCPTPQREIAPPPARRRGDFTPTTLTGVAPVWWRDDDLAMELTRYAYLRLMLGAGGNHAPRGDDGPVPTAASSGTWRSNAAGER
jgi:hypothetical protein